MVRRLLVWFARAGAGQHRHSGPWLLAALSLVAAGLACRGPGGPAALVFTPDQLPPANVGQPYFGTFSISQNVTPVGEMTIGLADLPPGMNFAFFKGQDKAEITGTPRRAGTYKFTISAWCFGTNTAGQTGHHDYVLVVQ